MYAHIANVASSTTNQEMAVKHVTAVCLPPKKGKLNVKNVHWENMLMPIKTKLLMTAKVVLLEVSTTT